MLANLGNGYSDIYTRIAMVVNPLAEGSPHNIQSKSSASFHANHFKFATGVKNVGPWSSTVQDA